jgi:hypothetical protein
MADIKEKNYEKKEGAGTARHGLVWFGLVWFLSIDIDVTPRFK